MYWLRFIVTFSLVISTGLQTEAKDLERRFRRPVALAASSNFKWVYTANQNSGSISVIDSSTRSVTAEIDIGGRLADLVAMDDKHLLALDEKNHQLILLTGQGVQWKVASRLKIAQYPIRIKMDRAGKRCFISSLWSQAVTMVDLSEIDRKQKPRLRVATKLHLSFEPREMCFVKGGKRLIVAGSFNNTMAVVDTDDLTIITIKKIPGHNIRGMALSSDGQRIWVAQQELNPLARSTRDDVHWGNMLSNLLVLLSVDDLCDLQADILKQRIPILLGGPGRAAGDPGAISVGPTGNLTVVLSGVNEVVLGNDRLENDFQRVSVGRRPSAAISSHDGRVFVADMFSDSISIVDAAGANRLDRVSLGPQPELSPVKLGEMLFFDSRLSHDSWMSCHSCHTDGHSNGQLNDNLSDGSFGTPKRVLSLLGVGQTGPWAWDGKVKDLSQQVKNSIQTTMQGKPPSNEQVTALIAYMNTLAPPPMRSDLAAVQYADATRLGRKLFQTLDCRRCHKPPTYTSQEVYDVGLKDAAENTRFNPPSLLAVGRRRSLFHDGRASALKEIFTRHKHQLSRELSNTELDSLVTFLMTL